MTGNHKEKKYLHRSKTIWCQQELKDRLNKIGRRYENYEEIIKRVLTEYENNHQEEVKTMETMEVKQ